MQLSSSTATRSPRATPIPRRALASRTPRSHDSPKVSSRPRLFTAIRSWLKAAVLRMALRTSKHRPLRSCREAGLAGGGGHPLEVRLELEREEAGPEPALHQRAAHQPQSGLAGTVPHAVHEAFVVVAPDGPHPVGYVVTEEPADAFLLVLVPGGQHDEAWPPRSAVT